MLVNRIRALAVAAILATTGLALTAAPSEAHIRSDSREYIGHCDAVVAFCVATPEDPSGNQLCSSGTCRTGGAVWRASTLVQVHDNVLGDGLDVKASIDDQLDPTWGWLCVAQETSETGDGDECNNPESEPDVAFCGTSPWLQEALVPPFEGDQFDSSEVRPDWAVILLGGPVTQTVSNAPDPIGGIDCSPLGAGATKGTITISVRE